MAKNSTKKLGKTFKRVLKSETPCNSAFALIPESKRKAFFKFASFFGYTESKIKSLLTHEKQGS